MGFLNAHQRLVVPAVLGPCTNMLDGSTFNRITDPATHVPVYIAFMNDGEVGVTLHFDAGVNKAEVYSSVNGPYAITAATNDQLLIAIDGEAAVAVTIPPSATQTVANVAAAINAAFVAAGGKTALAVAQPWGTSFRIVSGTTNGSSVSIQNPASHTANTTLGLAVGGSTPDNSFILDIVAPITIAAKGMGIFINPRPVAPSLQIRGVTSVAGTTTVIDATTLYNYSGVQQ